MLQRELKINLKTFLIWAFIIVVMLALVFAVYPSMDISKESMDQMLQMFPPEMLEAFNMDLIGMDSVRGWILTEGYLFITLFIGLYSAILGSTILLKEETDKTIEFLVPKPITKDKILTPKLITGYIYVTLYAVVIAITILIGLLITNDFNYIEWFLLSLGPLIIGIFFFSISLVLSLFQRKISSSIGISLGVVMISYLLKVISTITDKLEALKYISIFEYFDARYIIKDQAFKPEFILIGIVLIIGLNLISYNLYNKKEFF